MRSLHGICKPIAQVCRRHWTVRYELRPSRRTANLEAAPTRNESLDEQHGSLVVVELATAGPTFRGQDVHPLHHADIFVIEDVAMSDKAADGDRIEIRPKRDRSGYCVNDLRRRHRT